MGPQRDQSGVLQKTGGTPAAVRAAIAESKEPRALAREPPRKKAMLLTHSLQATPSPGNLQPSVSGINNSNNSCYYGDAIKCFRLMQRWHRCRASPLPLSPAIREVNPASFPTAGKNSSQPCLPGSTVGKTEPGLP